MPNTGVPFGGAVITQSRRSFLVDVSNASFSLGELAKTVEDKSPSWYSSLSMADKNVLRINPKRDAALSIAKQSLGRLLTQLAGSRANTAPAPEDAMSYPALVGVAPVTRASRVQVSRLGRALVLEFDAAPSEDQQSMLNMVANSPGVTASVADGKFQIIVFEAPELAVNAEASLISLMIEAGVIYVAPESEKVEVTETMATSPAERLVAMASDHASRHSQTVSAAIDLPDGTRVHLVFKDPGLF